MTQHRWRLILAVIFSTSLGLFASGPAVSNIHAAGGTLMVATTEGTLLTVRIGPGQDYPAMGAFNPGTLVEIVAGPESDDEGDLWYLVNGGGIEGWCAAVWLAEPVAGAGPTTRAGNTAGNSRSVDQTGDLNLRATPGLFGTILAVIPAGAVVTLRGDEAYADGLTWNLVIYNGIVGWVASNFLQGSGGATAAEDGSAGWAKLEVGSNAQVVGTDGYDLRMRDGIGPNAPIFRTVPANAVVTVVNGPLADETGAAWYGISYDGLYGWAAGQYLSPTIASASFRPQTDEEITSYSRGPVVSNPVRGQAIANAALQHLGTPYVWGGAIPSGWDCSGMIQWLYLNVAGVTLPRVSQAQWYAGTPLRKSELEAGDIVFFFDTDGPGITHNGIALGDGRFVHSRDASSGTVISWLSDPLWVAHYAGARRP